MSSLQKPFVSSVVDSSTAVLHVLYTSCNISHMLLSTGFKSGEFGGRSWGGINSGVSFCNNSKVARVRWAFQVSQGSVETLFRWGETCTSLWSKFIQETVYQISSELPKCYRRYYKKRFGLFFFLDTVYLWPQTLICILIDLHIMAYLQCVSVICELWVRKVCITAIASQRKWIRALQLVWKTIQWLYLL